MSWTSFEDCSRDVIVEEFSQAIQDRVKIPDIEKIAWSPSVRVYGTVNFFNTVARGNSEDVKDFLRSAQHLIVLPNHSLLLVSDQEADGILKEIWNASLPATISFVDLCRLESMSDSNESVAIDISQCTMVLKGISTPHVYLEDVTSVRMYEGETEYKQCKYVKAMLEHQSSRVVLKEYIGCRGNASRWAYSFLEKWCNDNF